MGTAYNDHELAQALANTVTVYTPDRRGRGLSPRDYNAAHEIARDVEDVEAVLEEAGASLVFGLSSGAMIDLEAVRTLPRVTRAAVYEPPFYPDGISHDGIRQLNLQIEHGDLPSALVTALLVAETAPAPLRVLPMPLARRLVRVVLFLDAWIPGRYAKLRDLLPGIRYGFNVVASMDGKMDTFAAVKKPM